LGEIGEAFATALRLIVRVDPGVVEIAWVSLRVALAAVALASLLGLPLGAWLAVARFRGRGALVILLNALMGLPPVVAGLVVYLALSRAGPLGGLGLLFTPTAMVLAQTVLVLPIVAALTRQTVADLREEYGEQLRSLGAGPLRAMATLLFEGRFSLATALLAGFGRAIAEVGAVIIVGGNIAHVTRTMTTAIALETSRGDLALALALGILLIALALAVNASAGGVREAARRAAG
jgi:tungstate transport system permease protein